MYHSAELNISAVYNPVRKSHIASFTSVSLLDVLHMRLCAGRLQPPLRTMPKAGNVQRAECSGSCGGRTCSSDGHLGTMYGGRSRAPGGCWVWMSARCRWPPAGTASCDPPCCAQSSRGSSARTFEHGAVIEDGRELFAVQCCGGDDQPQRLCPARDHTTKREVALQRQFCQYCKSQADCGSFDALSALQHICCKITFSGTRYAHLSQQGQKKTRTVDVMAWDGYTSCYTWTFETAVDI